MPEKNQPTHGKLRPDDEQAIRRNIRYIKEQLDAQYIVDSLVSHKVIDFDDKEEVLSAGTRKERTEILLDKILLSGPGDAYMIFLQTLKSNGYEHVAKTLTDHLHTIKK